MKVVHVLKRIETIDQDIKELRKLEKTVTGNKSFTTPIIMSIEKQINIILGERIKLLEMKIENPPAELVKVSDDEEDVYKEPKEKAPEQKPKEQKTGSRVKITSLNAKTEKKTKKSSADIDDDDFEIPMLTQDQIDAKISNLKNKDNSDIKADKKNDNIENQPVKNNNSDGIKLLDIALEKGSIEKQDSSKPKDKKIRFFRDNFPAE